MTCTTLLAAQDELADTDALDRVRIRRVWFMAERRERLTLEQKFAGASLFDRTVPDVEFGICTYPYCGLPSSRGHLCATHAKQRNRRGFLYVSAIGAPSPAPKVESPTCQRGHTEWRRERNGSRKCVACERERKALRRSDPTTIKPRDPTRLCVKGHAPNWNTSSLYPKCLTCKSENAKARRKAARSVSA